MLEGARCHKLNKKKTDNGLFTTGLAPPSTVYFPTIPAKMFSATSVCLSISAPCNHPQKLSEDHFSTACAFSLSTYSHAV